MELFLMKKRSHNYLGGAKYCDSSEQIFGFSKWLALKVKPYQRRHRSVSESKMFHTKIRVPSIHVKVGPNRS